MLGTQRIWVLGPEHIPAIYSPNPFGLVALPALLVLWIFANSWRFKSREA